MSISSALIAGVSGLAANSTALGVISDNIANANTVGYKKTNANFSTLVTRTSGISGYSAGGVAPVARTQITDQGLLEGTGSETDLGISGDGFFVVSESPQNTGAISSVLFTRAGSFTTDNSGFLRNAGGYFLQGWPVDNNGNFTANPSDLTLLEPVQVDQLGGTAEASTTVQVDANFQSSTAISAQEATYNAATNNMASGTVTPDFTTSIQVFDSQGGIRTVNLSALKSSTPNEWHAELHVTPAAQVTGTDGQIATGTIAFTTDGLLDTTNTSAAFLNSININWVASLGITTPQPITLDIGVGSSAGGLTQFDSPSSLLSSQVNGAVFGNLSGIEVNESGRIIAVFDNGIQRDIYQLPLATFVNPNGLQREQGNAYAITNLSGNFSLKVPGVAGAGLISSGTLEASTVDLAEEFSELIKTQRAYSASTRIITTADEMLEELIRLR